MKEEEIRPKGIFDEYLRLAEIDTRLFFSSDRIAVPCPACREVGKYAFEKNGFAYDECPQCLTLFVSPRPPAESFARYYREADSVKYWASTFYRETAEARREKLWRPKAKLVLEALRQVGAAGHSVIDIGGGYGIFAEEYEALSGGRVIVVEPGPALAIVCREKGLSVIESFLEDLRRDALPAGPRAFVSFELFEHLHDPSRFLRHLRGLMRSGDVFLFTTLSGTGLDIQVLWDQSKSVSPPHHLNFFNPDSVRNLLDREALRVLDISTPGELDIDILCNNHSLIRDRFWRALMQRLDDAGKEKWQSFIAENGCSSHMMVLCQRP
jgi:SAM-dependent methyltransferase